MIDKRKNIFITGASGFIGSHLVNYFAQTDLFNIFALTRKTVKTQKIKNIKYIQANILDLKSLTAVVKHADIVIHTSAIVDTAQSTVDMQRMFNVNVNGTINVLEAIKQAKVEFSIIFSSSSVYGNRIQKKIDESHPTNPISLYGASKLAADRIAYAYARRYFLPLVIVRPFNIYGPGQKSGNVIPKFISTLSQNQVITLNNGGTQSRDFLYIDDLVDAVSKLVEKRKKMQSGDVFNICSGNEYSIKLIAEKILKKLDKTTRFIKNQSFKQSEVISEIGDYKKLTMLTKWKPLINIDVGISKSVEWWIT